jgi:hypothetical protein
VKIRSLIAVGAIIFGGFTTADASVITFSDTFNPADVLFEKDNNGAACTGLNGAADSVSGAVSGKCDSLVFTQLLDGFNPATDTLTSAGLTLTFHDNNGHPAVEKFTYLIDLATGDVTITSGGVPFVWSLNALSLLGDGQLAIKLTAKNGDFIFDSAVLTAAGDRIVITEPVDVPEPASMVLFGVGALVLGAKIRRRRKSSAV